MERRAMKSVGQKEAETQKRVIQFFQEELDYDYLGHWKKRDGKSNVEQELLSNWLNEALPAEPTILALAKAPRRKDKGEILCVLCERFSIFATLATGVGLNRRTQATTRCARPMGESQPRMVIDKSQATALANSMGADDYPKWMGHPVVLSEDTAVSNIPAFVISCTPDPPSTTPAISRSGPSTARLQNTVAACEVGAQHQPADIDPGTSGDSNLPSTTDHKKSPSAPLWVQISASTCLARHERIDQVAPSSQPTER